MSDQVAGVIRAESKCPPVGLAVYFTESWVIGRGSFAASIAYPLDPQAIHARARASEIQRLGYILARYPVPESPEIALASLDSEFAGYLCEPWADVCERSEMERSAG